MNSEECPRCNGQGVVIVSETCDQYDHWWLQWGDCDNCQGEGFVLVEPEDDDE